MVQENGPMQAKEALEKYFLDNRARMLEIASFLDRIDRYSGSSEAKEDFRYKSLVDALKIIVETENDRTKYVQLRLSDLSDKPVENIIDPKAYGAWKESISEGD
ncbi:MAG: hypothetical protein HY807_12135 [Nitrospirae bacterium]|nr:hypothetical protein [Nitrospirota bacterium]